MLNKKEKYTVGIHLNPTECYVIIILKIFWIIFKLIKMEENNLFSCTNTHAHNYIHLCILGML